MMMLITSTLWALVAAVLGATNKAKVLANRTCQDQAILLYALFSGRLSSGTKCTVAKRYVV